MQFAECDLVLREFKVMAALNIIINLQKTVAFESSLKPQTTISFPLTDFMAHQHKICEQQSCLTASQ